MIIVWGSIVCKPDKAQELLKLSKAHVERSRTEPGCIRHGVYLDPDDPLRLVFYEEWQDHAALKRHFEVPASQQFALQARTLATAPPELRICRAEPVG